VHTEAHHLEVLNHNFAGQYWSHVSFPRPLFADETVIMETFEKGAVVTDMMTFLGNIGKEENAGELERILQKVGNDMHAVGGVGNDITNGYDLIPLELSQLIVTSGCSLYLKMMIDDGLMHADLHPGNILVRVESGTTGWEDGDDGDERRSGMELRRTSTTTKQRLPPFKGAVKIVDAGMVAKLTEEEQINFVGLLASLGDGDATSAANAILRFSDISDDDKDALTPQAKEDFRRDMATLFAERCRGYRTGTDLGDVLRGILGLIRTYRIRIDANYATLVVNTLCLHGMASKFVPSYNVLDASEALFTPFKRFYMNGPTSPFMRRLFKIYAPLLQRKKNVEDRKFFRKLRRQKTKMLRRMRTSRMIK